MHRGVLDFRWRASWPVEAAALSSRDRGWCLASCSSCWCDSGWVLACLVGFGVFFYIHLLVARNGQDSKAGAQGTQDYKPQCSCSVLGLVPPAPAAEGKPWQQIEVGLEHRGACSQQWLVTGSSAGNPLAFIHLFAYSCGNHYWCWL